MNADCVDVLLKMIRQETDLEFDGVILRDDPDLDEKARGWRDYELFLDLTGNLDSCV